jgi:hypothetical protein
MKRQFRALFANIPLISVMVILVLLIHPSYAQLIESTLGQTLTGTIPLGDGLGENDLVVSGEVNMAGLSPTQPPILQQGLITVSVPDQESWEIKVKSDDVANGFMTEYDILNNNYINNGKKLKTPMLVWIDDNNKADLSDGERSIKSGIGPGTFSVYYEQGAVWGDATLPDGRKYNMIITFTLS